MSGADFTPWPEADAARYRASGCWTGISLGAALHAQAQRTPDRLALVCGERRWTHAELDRRAAALAAGFARIGIRARDRVVVQLPNIAEFFSVVLALFRIGAWPVFALPAHRRSELLHFCTSTDASALVIADVHAGFDYRILARDVAASSPSLRHVIVAGDAQELVALDTLYDAPAAATWPSAGEVAFLQLSGGSTGLPKLIPRTHDDYLYSVRTSIPLCGLDASSVYLCALPAAHNFALSSPGTLGTLLAGGCVVLARQPDADTAFALIESERVTITAVVPPLAKVWLDAAPGSSRDLSSLAVLQVGGAALSEAVARRVRPVLGCALQQVFGMAEGLVNYTRLDDDDTSIASTQGRPMSPFDEVRIVDDDDVDVADGEPGHLLTRGPYTIRGYYRADAHNRRAFTHDGFYRTGDVVRRLASGHLVVEGRAKDQINRGGDKIAAEEVENHLLAHPAVHDVALVAMPDAYLGERACAFVIARSAPLPAAELRRFLRDRGIADFKLPDRIEWIAELPKTGVGKVDKRALRERVAMQLRTL